MIRFKNEKKNKKNNQQPATRCTATVCLCLERWCKVDDDPIKVHDENKTKWLPVVDFSRGEVFFFFSSVSDSPELFSFSPSLLSVIVFLSHLIFFSFSLHPLFLFSLSQFLFVYIFLFIFLPFSFSFFCFFLFFVLWLIVSPSSSYLMLTHPFLPPLFLFSSFLI